MSTSPHAQLLRRVPPSRANRLCIWAGIAALAAAGFGASGCAKAQANIAPEGPPLDIPAPPPRIIAPADEPLASSVAEPSEPATAPGSTTRRPVRRPPAASEEEPKPEAAPPADVAVEEAAAPAEPAPTLRAPGRDAAENAIRDRLAIARRDLNRVDYARLSQDGRAQYEQSKRFIEQAEQAVKAQNFVFATTLADKAATLAAELLGR